MEGRINRANAPEAQRIWTLVDESYVPIDWQLDFKSGYRWKATEWSADIDPLGNLPGVDIKVPWELARCQHLPQLALAFCVLGKDDAQLARSITREFSNQILDFIALNPPRYGVNWVCAMDVAIRAVNWLIAYDLLKAGGATFAHSFESVFARSIHEHGWHVANNLEWTDGLRSNHYLANVCGLAFIAAYLPFTAETNAWLAFAIPELGREADLQFHEEGSNRECSTSYHRLCSELVVYTTALALGISKRRLAIRFPPSFCERLERMAEFTLNIARPDGTIPQIGDNDSGRLLKLPGAYRLSSVSDVKGKYGNLQTYAELGENASFPEELVLDHRHLVAAIDGLVERPDFAAFGAPHRLETDLVRAIAREERLRSDRRSDPETARAIGDDASFDNALAVVRQLPATHRRTYRMKSERGMLRSGLCTVAYPAFGIFVCRSPNLYLAIRCGKPDPRGSGAHAHNDQLSIELDIDGARVIADPGTYLYTPFPQIRNRYRSMAAHFAPRVPDREPGDLSQGLFTLRDHADARCLYFGDRGFAGSHVGFGEPVYRVILLDDSAITIEDGSLGEPLAALNTYSSLPISPKYGWIDR